MEQAKVELVEGKQFGAVKGAVLSAVGIIGIGIVAYINLVNNGVDFHDQGLVTDKIVAGMIIGAFVLGVSVTSFVCKKSK